ncbi:MAG: isocitrate/isopropylmalate family dehydrogenase, partial [Brevundimonas sp.]
MVDPRTYNIVLLPGDGVGPEVTSAAKSVLQCIGDFYGHRFEFSEHLIGGAGIDAVGDPLPPETTEA